MYTLANGIKLNFENPNTFWIPSNDEKANVKVGDYVKLIFRPIHPINENDPSERMWVRIIEINDDEFTGILDNQPFFIQNLFYGDEVTFEKRHIIDILGA